MCFVVEFLLAAYTILNNTTVVRRLARSSGLKLTVGNILIREGKWGHAKVLAFFISERFRLLGFGSQGHPPFGYF